jgi:2,3-bisphosphoglycerate-independent phosphoglycerate mutase
VHSHQDHLIALAAACGRRGVRPVLHAFLDGRDTPPRSAETFLARCCRTRGGGGQVATVSGRYWAMDRDNRWERVGRAYHAIVCREGIAAPDALAAVRAAYARDENDEFVQPAVIDGGAALEDGDVALFFNFRADRAREITNALTSVRPERFAGQLERRKIVAPALFVCMTEYDASFGCRSPSTTRRRTTSSARSSRPRASRSCAWRRPRSTRT